jgi:tetrapyrrole methylase family protein/MazG family protein
MNNHASLVLVGTGIKFLSHLTTEAITYIKQSDKVLFLVNDPAIKEWIMSHNANAESLEFFYAQHELRKDNYKDITDYILTELRKQQHVCVVLYGHPSVFAKPGLAAIKIAQAESFYARILPGISAEACLFADLLIDPGSHGCHSFEATDFLLYKRTFDPHGHLILWQINAIGVLNNPEHHDHRKGTQLLVTHLKNVYPDNHPVIVYEAAQYPGFEPTINRLSLSELPNSSLSKLSTLYVPPIKNNRYDQTFIDDMGIAINDLLM